MHRLNIYFPHVFPILRCGILSDKTESTARRVLIPLYCLSGASPGMSLDEFTGGACLRVPEGYGAKSTKVNWLFALLQGS